jgi:hypothetical protein
MRALKKIPSSNIFAIDIETVRLAEKFEDLDERFQDAWTYKNKQNGIIPEPDELADLWERTASLYAEFAKICAVSICWADKKDNLYVREYYSEDETELLTLVLQSLEKIYDGDKDSLLAGHASKYFDFPFICKRLIINRFEIPKILDNVLGKPWDAKNVLCTNNDLWKMGFLGPGSSLQALCTVLNVPVSKVDLVGDEVGREYFKGNLSGIGRYCSYDAIATLNVIRVLKGEDIFEFDQATYLNASNKVAEVPVLVRIYNNNSISTKDKEDLLAILDKKRLTKKGKGILVDMLYNLSLSDDMFNKDTKDMQEEKLSKAKDLIEEL